MGGRSDDRIHAIATDAQGNIYLAGSTYSTDFPGVSGKQNNSEDIVIASFNAAGTTLRWATVIGGSGTDQANAIAIDDNGHLWLTGLTDSTDFPVTAGGAALPVIMMWSLPKLTEQRVPCSIVIFLATPVRIRAMHWSLPPTARSISPARSATMPVSLMFW
ncbi:MAG: SBBP repeat-containing protein [Caldilineaceae bacterium]